MNAHPRKGQPAFPGGRKFHTIFPRIRHMQKPRLAFIYNVRHRYPDPSDPISQREADFDDQGTVDAIRGYLERIAGGVVAIEADENAYPRLQAHRSDIDLAFNYSMGLNGASRYCHIPAMLEMLRIPYTGSSPLTQAVLMNKAKMQEVLRGNGLPALRSRIITNEGDIHAEPFSFPCMIKPIAQGSSAGITNKSIVHSAEALAKQARAILDIFREPALVQPFLDGREFSVPMLGPDPVRPGRQSVCS
jgi:D-alanine-D-alanine ligase